MDQHDEPGCGERPGHALEAVLLGPGEAMGHGDGRAGPGRVRQEQPGAQFDAAFRGNPDIDLRNQTGLLDNRPLSPDRDAAHPDSRPHMLLDPPRGQRAKRCLDSSLRGVDKQHMTGRLELVNEV